MKTKDTASQYEEFCDIVREYEAIYGTSKCTGNSSRDEEYRKLLARREELRRQNLSR